jgi:hypothetical protein
VRGLVDAVVRGLPEAGVAARAAVCEAALVELVTLRPGEGATARAALAEGRWGAGGDGVSLARAMRDYGLASSSLLSAK